jgi:hypothetical protein
LTEASRSVRLRIGTRESHMKLQYLSTGRRQPQIKEINLYAVTGGTVTHFDLSLARKAKRRTRNYFYSMDNADHSLVADSDEAKSVAGQKAENYIKRTLKREYVGFNPTVLAEIQNDFAVGLLRPAVRPKVWLWSNVSGRKETLRYPSYPLEFLRASSLGSPIEGPS